MNQYLDSPAARFQRPRNRYAQQKQNCPQVSEAAVGSDLFVLDVLEFFFNERLTEGQLNDALRQVASDAIWRATQGSDAMDLVPRPPGNRPTPLWLISQAVQIAFRRAQNRCIYEAVRVVVKAALRSDYELAKIGAGAMSRHARPFNVNSLATSDNGLRFISRHEGFRANLYNDPVGHCTIGFGTLVHRGNCNGSESEEFRNGITEDRARELMRNEFATVEAAINSSVTVPLNQNQFDALVSFAYNVGTGAFRRSTLLRRLNEGNFGAVQSELMKWVNASGQRLPGLVRRREEESALFNTPPAAAQSMEKRAFSRASTYKYESPSRIAGELSQYARAQNPGLVAGIAVADAIQIGLGTVAVVQTAVSASQGSFSLSYDKAQRILTSEARASMPGAQSSKQNYRRRVFLITGGAPIAGARADVIIEWEGNPYGEISTPVIRRDLQGSTEWSSSACNITITKIDRIPLPDTDPRTWPVFYSYEGTYNPLANGYFEFSGEFEINAFGGIKFNRHEVVDRSLVESLPLRPEQYVQKGADNIPAVPQVPQEQLNYLRTRL